MEKYVQEIIKLDKVTTYKKPMKLLKFSKLLAVVEK